MLNILQLKQFNQIFNFVFFQFILRLFMMFMVMMHKQLNLTDKFRIYRTINQVFQKLDFTNTQTLMNQNPKLPMISGLSTRSITSPRSKTALLHEKKNNQAQAETKDQEDFEKEKFNLIHQLSQLRMDSTRKETEKRRIELRNNELMEKLKQYELKMKSQQSYLQETRTSLKEMTELSAGSQLDFNQHLKAVYKYFLESLHHLALFSEDENQLLAEKQELPQFPVQKENHAQHFEGLFKILKKTPKVSTNLEKYEKIKEKCDKVKNEHLEKSEKMFQRVFEKLGQNFAQLISEKSNIQELQEMKQMFQSNYLNQSYQSIQGGNFLQGLQSHQNGQSQQGAGIQKIDTSQSFINCQNDMQSKKSLFLDESQFNLLENEQNSPQGSPRFDESPDIKRLSEKRLSINGFQLPFMMQSQTQDFNDPQIVKQIKNQFNNSTNNMQNFSSNQQGRSNYREGLLSSHKKKGSMTQAKSGHSNVFIDMNYEVERNTLKVEPFRRGFSLANNQLETVTPTNQAQRQNQQAQELSFSKNIPEDLKEDCQSQNDFILSTENQQKSSQAQNEVYLSYEERIVQVELKKMERQAKLKALEKLKSKNSQLDTKLENLREEIKQVNLDLVNMQRCFVQKMEQLTVAEDLHFQKKQERVILNSTLKNSQAKLNKMNSFAQMRSTKPGVLLENEPSNQSQINQQSIGMGAGKKDPLRRQNSSINCFKSMQFTQGQLKENSLNY